MREAQSISSCPGNQGPPDQPGWKLPHLERWWEACQFLTVWETISYRYIPFRAEA